MAEVNCAHCKILFDNEKTLHKSIYCEACYSSHHISFQQPSICSWCSQNFYQEKGKRASKLCKECLIKKNSPVPHQCSKCQTPIGQGSKHLSKYFCKECFEQRLIAKRRSIKDFNQEGFIFQPKNKQEVVVLFFRCLEKFGFTKIQSVQLGFPDAVVIDKEEHPRKIEFEFLSSKFRSHLKQMRQENILVDYLVCWYKDRDFREIPGLKVIELCSFFKNQTNC